MNKNKVLVFKILILLIIVLSIVYFNNLEHYFMFDTEEDIQYLETDRLEKIIEAFDEFNLFLKPQSSELIDDYYDLNGLKPNIYELLDDSLLIYCFEDSKDLIKGLERAEKLFEKNFYYYIVENDILIIYYPNDYFLEVTNTIQSQIKRVVESIENSNES